MFSAKTVPPHDGSVHHLANVVFAPRLFVPTIRSHRFVDHFISPDGVVHCDKPAWARQRVRFLSHAFPAFERIESTAERSFRFLQNAVSSCAVRTRRRARNDKLT